jgi:hypothetical protein
MANGNQTISIPANQLVENRRKGSDDGNKAAFDKQHSKYCDSRNNFSAPGQNHPAIETPPDECERMALDDFPEDLFPDMSNELPVFSENAISTLRDRSMSSTDRPLQHRFGSQAGGHREADGAFRRCEARAERLDRLNATMEEFCKEDWSESNTRVLLEHRLKQNRFAPAIRASLQAIRLRTLHARPELIAAAAYEPPSPDLNLSGRARACGPAVAGELTSLRMVQQQTVTAVAAMLRSASADVPLSGEEARAVVARARRAYAPAKLALRSAVDELERHRSPAAAAAAAAAAAGKQRKGLLTEEAKRVLEDWTLSHLHNPYPNDGEKKASALPFHQGLPSRPSLQSRAAL